MIEETAWRATRRFDVYKGRRLALRMADIPGVLQSTAPLPSGVSASFSAHSFVDAQACDAVSEDELGRLLQQSVNFDDYVTRLLDAGYAIASMGAFPQHELDNGFQIDDNRGMVVGVVWKREGQFASLKRQPPEDELVFDHAMLTIYQEDRAGDLLEMLQTTSTFEELKDCLEIRGFRLVPLTV